LQACPPFSIRAAAAAFAPGRAIMIKWSLPGHSRPAHGPAM